HDFYNRTQNKWPIRPLPQLYKPLSAIHRVDPTPVTTMDRRTKYYTDEVPTIYFIADPAEIASMHEHRMEKIKVTARMFYISSSQIHEFSNVRLRVAGRSSRSIPKLSYDIKIRKQADATLNGYRRLKLRAFGYDPSYIRENLAYRVLESLGMPASSFSYVRMFINDQAIGLFGLVEAYTDSWPQNEFGYGQNEYQQGFLYQAKSVKVLGRPTQYISDLRYHNSSSKYPYAQGQYKIKAKPSLGDSSFIPLAELIEFIAQAPTDDSPQTIREWQQHLDMESVLRSLALEIIIGFADGFISMADNYCLYQNGYNSTQFIFVPADLDSTFGQTLLPISQMLDGDYTQYPGFQNRGFLNKILQVRPFKDRFESLLKNIARRLINLDVLDETIDDLVTMLKQDVKWDQSLPRV
ncbi:coth protein-domain-containing protein, partial [Zychaea mexicana]|uniref:coth protein-domain-containing protein n=1 Tax=Zychaea mexicana TaxID=64656 RepID=UPI0022FE6172